MLCGTDGDTLGVGCSDLYSSGLNGQQSNMGPKFEVNAFTGEYPYPATDLNLTGNGIYKRVQIPIAELDPNQNGGGSTSSKVSTSVRTTTLRSTV